MAATASRRSDNRFDKAVSSPEGHVNTEPLCSNSTAVFAKDYGTLQIK